MEIEAPAHQPTIQKQQEAVNGHGDRPGWRRRRRGLLAIVYSEFDNTLGPTIRFQAPDGYVRVHVCAGTNEGTNQSIDQSIDKSAEGH